MNGKEYVQAVLKTESNDFEQIKLRLTWDNTNHFTLRLLHAALGASTEANELIDVVKKAIFYGKDIDWTNVKEELGDMLWYIAIACDVAGISIEDIMKQNIAKLHARYGISFNEEGAMNRDLSRERYILEKDGSRKEEAGIGIKPKNPAGSIFHDNAKMVTEDCLDIVKDITSIGDLQPPEICPIGCQLEIQIGRHFKSDHYSAARGEFK